MSLCRDWVESVAIWCAHSQCGATIEFSDNKPN